MQQTYLFLYLPKYSATNFTIEWIEHRFLSSFQVEVTRLLEGCQSKNQSFVTRGIKLDTVPAELRIGGC